MMRPITNDEVQRLVEQEGGQLVEVLPRDSFEQEHIAGAMSLPLKELTAESVTGLDRSRPIIVNCSDYR
ncbi:MAG: rhodanese-like domain-containing protein [Actinomycetota bacterium]|nr:rhodanese-like domain-containing protein [Actinomycetota bacterium]